MQGRISDLVPDAARRFGDALALTVVGGERLSFSQIEERVAGFAGWLTERSIGRGDRVVLYLPNGANWLIAYHAIARLGAVVVPANFLLTVIEVAFMISDASARAIILPADHASGVRGLIDVAAAVLIVTVDDDMPQAASTDSVDVRPDDLFTLGYTSGTTGRPKGAMLTHANIYASTAMTATIHLRRRGETVLTALPFPHVYGNVVMNAAFLVGMHLLVMRRFDAGNALQAIDLYRPAIFEGVPTMYYQLLAHDALIRTDLTSLRLCTVGGQAMPVARIDEVVARFGCPLCELWGMTEVAGPATTHSPYWIPRHGSIGLPLPSVELRVVGDDGNTVADGEVGELRVRGPLVTRGYWQQPDATAASFDNDGWFATGDLGIRDSDGYFRIVDRRKDLIITGGYNIYPAEVEQVLALHPAVAMSAVAPIADPVKGELAKAYIVLRPQHAADPAALEAHCRVYLAAYKVPRLFAFVDDLPMTSTGKIMRRSLRDHVPAS